MQVKFSDGQGEVIVEPDPAMGDGKVYIEAWDGYGDNVGIVINQDDLSKLISLLQSHYKG